MEWLLAFFSDLILFTFGLCVLIAWVVFLIVIAIEVHDAIFGDPTDSPDQEQHNA